jgi:hypothetical protein
VTGHDDIAIKWVHRSKAIEAMAAAVSPGACTFVTLRENTIMFCITICLFDAGYALDITTAPRSRLPAVNQG